MSIAKIKASDGRSYAEYLDGKTKAMGAEKSGETRVSDYYTGTSAEAVTAAGEPVEAPGRWASGAELVGVSPAATDDHGQRIYAPVTGEQLRSLLAVERPDTGEELRATGPGGVAVPGIDMTFSPPKSVSAVWALADPVAQAQIEAAHERAVDRALVHVRDHVPVGRVHRRGEDPERVLVRDLIATSWRHTTARASAVSRLPDPQLHSHVIVHAAQRSDGRIVAVDSYALLREQRAIGASYDAAMATEMRALGYGIRTSTGRDGRYFEVAGVPDSLIRAWSSRAEVVEAELRQRVGEREQELQDAIATARAAGQTDQAERDEQRLERLRSTQRLVGAEHRAAATSTRLPKGEVSHGDLFAVWSAEAREHGMTGLEVADLRRPGLGEEQPEVELDALLLERLTEHDAAVEPHVAEAIAMEGGTRDPDAALAALHRLHRSGDIVHLRVPARKEGAEPVRVVTTQAQIAREQRALGALEAVAAMPAAACSERTVDRAVDAGEHELSAEQRNVVAQTTGGDALAVVVGPAGSGKSLALQATARAHAAEGRSVLVVAPTGVTAQRLAAELGESGTPTEALTGAKLRQEWEHENIAAGPDEVWIVDEAAAMNTRELEAVASLARDGGTRLILVGDPKQHGSVAAGGLWSTVEETARGRDQLVGLKELRRARDPADRQAQWLWRVGKQSEAVADLDARGRVHIHERSPEEARVDDALSLTPSERDALVHAQAQREAGADVLVTAETTNAHLDVLNAMAQSLASESRPTDTRSAAIATAPERPYKLLAGDPLQVRRNMETEGLGRLRNGTTGEVMAVGPSPDGGWWGAEVRLSDGRVGWLGERELAEGDVRLAYVMHPMVAQGSTVEHAHVLAGAATTAEGAYVGITRARGEAHIWADETLLELQASREAAAAGDEFESDAAEDLSDGERLRLLAGAMSRSGESLGVLATVEVDRPGEAEAWRDEGVGENDGAPGAAAGETDRDADAAWRREELERIQRDQQRREAEAEPARENDDAPGTAVRETERDADAAWQREELERIQRDEQRREAEAEMEHEWEM